MEFLFAFFHTFILYKLQLGKKYPPYRSAFTMDLNHEAVRVRSPLFPLGNIRMILSIWGYNLPDLTAAIQVCFAVDCGPRTREAVTVNRINRLINRVRASRAPKTVYRYLLVHLHAAPDQPGAFPYDLEECRRLVVNSPLFQEGGLPYWLPFSTRFGITTFGHPF